MCPPTHPRTADSGGLISAPRTATRFRPAAGTTPCRRSRFWALGFRAMVYSQSSSPAERADISPARQCCVVMEIRLTRPQGATGFRNVPKLNAQFMSLPLWLNNLNSEVIACTRCPRLVAYRQQVAREKRRAYRDWYYWGKPVPGFGDPNARVVVLGLAPGAHGSNRTGRPFTGDASGKFMYPILFETGFSNQPGATDRNDGLLLKDMYITAAARCAPPDNKPLPQELANCAPYLDRELQGLSNAKVIVALGKIAFDAYLNSLKRQGKLESKKGLIFQHGAKYKMPDGRTLVASYHPSNQNTQTGKLTREMFLRVFKEAACLADE